MANLTKAEAVFEQVLEAFVGAENAYEAQVALRGGQYIENKQITKNRAATFRKQFKEALDEEEAPAE